MSYESIVEQRIKCKQHLPFEVIAVPQYDNSQLVNGVENNLTDTVNVKIRIRNREETGKKHGIISVPKSSTNSGRKLRLIKSDQTIMSFDFYVEPDKTRKHQKKSHKNIFHIFKPGGCLKTQEDNDDEYHYSPSCFTDVRDIKCPSDIANDQMNIISEKITLKKNFPLITPTNITTRTAGNFMGKCKPGGCLDPPFNEDKYSYEPEIVTSNTNLNKQINANRDDLIRKTTIDSLNILNNIKTNKQEISKNIVKTQLDDDLYQENYSQSLITYPTTSSNSLQVYKQSYDTKVKKRISSEDKARISINEFSEIYFMPPKKDKANKLEKEPSLNISDNKNSVHSLISHRQLESATPITDTAISANNNILESKFNIVLQTRYSSLNKTNSDVEVSNDCHDTLEDVKPPEFRQSIQIPVLKSYSIEYLGYHITSNKSSKINLPDTDEAKKNLFESKKTSSQKKVSSNKSSTDSMIQIEATEELILMDRQELLVKESIETGQIDETNQSSLKNKDVKINTNNETDHIADPAKKITDEANSFRLYQESFKIDCESENEKIADTNTIKTPYLKSEHLQNINSYNDLNNVLSKHSKRSIKESQEFITKNFGENTKMDEVKTMLNKSEEIKDKDNINIDNTCDTIVQAKEFKSSKKSLENLTKTFLKVFDENEMIQSLPTSLEIENLETNNAFTEVEETALDPVMSKDQDNRYFENSLKPEHIFLDSISIPFKKQESTDILTTEEVDYAATKLNLENNNLTDILIVSDDSTLNKSVIITPIETLTSKISDDKLSSISLMQDRTHKTNFDENTTIGLQDLKQKKYEYLSESLNSAFGLEKGIEVVSNKDFDELVTSKTSMDHKTSDFITNQVAELEYKTSSLIPRAVENIDDKYKYDLNATHDYNMEDTKQPFFVSTTFSDENSIKSQSSIDRAAEEKDNSCIEQPSNGDNLDISSYSSITIDFGFRCSVNNDNKLEIHTFDTSKPSYDDENIKVNVIKSTIRVNDDEIRIPINFDIDLSMQIRKARMMSEDIISKKKNTLEQHFTERSINATVNKDYLLQETLNSVYENLIPLNKIIQNLKEEANTLSRQQNSFKKILEIMETKPKRLIHTDPLCGCEKK